MIQFRDVEVIQKGWGRERVIANNELYCGKILCYDKPGAVSSAHFHIKKTETFYIERGVFLIFYWDHLGNKTVKKASMNSVIHIPAGTPHQLVCVEIGEIFEVSTPHSDDDVVRIEPGDSQKTKEELHWKCPTCDRPLPQEELSRLRAEHGVYE